MKRNTLHRVTRQNRFTEHFSEPIKRARAMNATASDRRLGEKRLKELDAIRGRNMIRRTKVTAAPLLLSLTLSLSSCGSHACIHGVMSQGGCVLFSCVCVSISKECHVFLLCCSSRFASFFSLFNPSESSASVNLTG